MTMTTVQLSPEDALTFIAFQKHYAFIKLMESLGVFAITSGSVEVHFDGMGQIGSVDVRRHFRPKDVDKVA